MANVKISDQVAKEQTRHFEGLKSGRSNFKPLSHVTPEGKKGNDFSDLDYVKLLGARCLEIDEQADKVGNPIVDYGEGFDISTCEFAKKIVTALNDGSLNDAQASEYIKKSIRLER